MNALDQTLFTAINAGSSTWGATAWFAYIAARYVVMLIPLHLAVLWTLGDDGVRRQALLLTYALVVAIAASFVIGALFPTQRPFLVPLGHHLLDHRDSPSFPSNHGLVMFTYAATMGYLRHWQHALVIGSVGLIVAWSRVYLGVHFPFDMIGASMLAVVAVGAAVMIDKVLGRRLFVLAEGVYEAIVIRPLDRLWKKAGWMRD